MPIQILPEEVASQIAAGEVVERPASVVKELIENALDAGADQITILVREAGKRLIEVVDNGAGIPAKELSLAVHRHATSKLLDAADLFRVSTLGFRGEALASIGSVSQLSLLSRVQREDMGAGVRVEGGEIKPITQLGMPPGTTVRVEHLFYNVPARLKFLKTDRTEKRQINDVVSRYGLANPGVRLKLFQDEKLVFQTSGSGDTREVISTVYGVGTARKMLEVLYEDHVLKVNGFISPPGLTRSNRREILFFVNRRPVKDPALSKALTQAYHTFLMKGRFPMAVLFLELPPEKVDVNVHPTKAEVRFEQKGDIFRSVGRAVRRALLAHTPVPEVGNLGGVNLWGGPAPDHSDVQRRTDLAWEMLEDAKQEGSLSGPVEYHQVPVGVGTPILRLIGQVAATYLIAEGPDGLYLIDQHAAHERILFEQFLSNRDKNVPSQILLESIVVEFPPGAADLVNEHLVLLGELGFDLESFGPGAYVIRAVPALLGGSSPEAILRAAVEDLEVDETPLEKNHEQKIIARICKRAAVKAGQLLSPEESKQLLLDLEACQSPRTCPHGRPTMIHLSVDLLERKFGRTGPG
ncbi:MAG: DNA mismatch repair endonuclease MutL [Anaerolineales bacterium]|nr:DNA mismatch repair endonuclease MutL [Anaerolineales bacterium]